MMVLLVGKGAGVSAQEQITVRYAEHPTFSRVVFDFNREVSYQVSKNGSVLAVTFDADFTPQFGTLPTDPMRDMRNPSVVSADRQTVVRFDVVPDGAPRHFRSGLSIVVDMMADGSSIVSDSSPSVPSTSTGSNISNPPSDQEEVSSGVQPAGTGGDTADDLSSSTPEQDTPLALPPVPLGDVSDEEPLDVLLSGAAGRIQMTFPWQDTVGAAAFTRNNQVWVVFDQPRSFSPQGLSDNQALLQTMVRSVDTVPHPDATILRMTVSRDVNTVFERRQGAWVLTLQDTVAEPRFPLQPIKRIERTEGQQVFVPLTTAGRAIEIEDPLIGDLMVVMPLRAEGRGLAETYRYALADLHESSQGLVILPLSDGVRVEVFNEGVSISNLDPSLLAAENSNQSGSGFTRLIDFDAWRLGETNEYRKIKARLLYELSLEGRSDANNGRWKLARYYLSHRRPQEAIGVLERMLAAEPSLTDNGEYNAVRGVANTMAHRYAAAEEDFAHPDLLVSPDIDLWRTMVAEAQGNFADALTYYNRGKDVIGPYEDREKAEMQLAAIRAAIAENALELADRELMLLNGLVLNEEQASEAVYHSARIARLRGDGLIADAQFQDLVSSPVRELSARARYELLKKQLEANEIDVPTAIEALERLRYAWRGGNFEVDILDDLAGLYFAEGDYESGLTTLKLGVSYYPAAARERRMSTRMVEVFRRLYLDGEAEVIEPITAISLFYKFRELTPLGTDGDMMIRRLADRLVAVDLLDRAADLLLYQVQERTEGAARAQIAANLAKLYILDERPELALEIMRATREPQLPADILAERNRVEARALMEMDRFEEAEVLLEPDLSADADAMRADIYWGSKDYAAVIRANRKLLSGTDEASVLNPLQRLYLLRLAIAMTFEEDRAGLIQIRETYRNQMRDGEFANAFDLLTSDQILTGRELGAIAGQIASIDKLESFMRDYRSDFSTN
ncbi:hypothetical protein GCM10017044_25710 [Kordiimonas sediminis]|uniref:Tetratricopeptide repeat protein n=2 Tax=Kordiimonas sediminis TaxID=1735581 RepID=A0A919AY96_9PROT|nr:hypothetical protein GCM10017044_25710 [Kordiimonas sediminis]